MKKLILIFLSILPCCYLTSQPRTFSWNNRHGNANGGIDYVSPAEDQKEQGPCGIFATVAAVEAVTQIYFNNAGADLNLSEGNLYSTCAGITEGSAGNALPFFVSTGAVDDDSWPYPDSPINNNYPYYLQTQCNLYTSYDYKVKIPGWGQYTNLLQTLSITNNKDLKKAIMDYGPIIMVSTGANQAGDSLGIVLHPGNQLNNINHSILVTGWDSTTVLSWEIKDSWPGDRSDQSLVSINLFDYSPYFYCIYPVYNENGITKYLTCKDEYGSNYITTLPEVDDDKDGFYRWGFDAYPPSGFTGINMMDFNDYDSLTIFRDGYDPLPGPYITNVSNKYVCYDGIKFPLKNFTNKLSQMGFTIDWSLSPSGYFYSPTAGSDTSAFVNPLPNYIGKKCKLEYHLKYNGNLVKAYKFWFVINGPREDQVSISVLDSYGASAEGSGDFFYLCANKNYTIYYNNNDFNCSVSNFQWTLPSGWTKNYQYGNYVSINTNDTPYGYLQINATTCCGADLNVKNVYFGDANCDGYFMVYPNPANNSAEINIIQSMAEKDGLSLNDECVLTVIDKSGIILNKNKFTGFPYTLDTSNLSKGIYFINILYNGKKSTIQLVVQH